MLFEIVRPGMEDPNLQKNRKIQGSDSQRVLRRKRVHAKMRRGNEKGCLNRGNGMTNGAVGIVCPGCDAARAKAKRCIADPGPRERWCS